MKKLALLINALLLFTMLFLVLSEGFVSPSAWLALAAPALTLFAFRSHFTHAGKIDSSAEQRAAAAPGPRGVEAPADRKPLYEWLETVEDRLDAVETERTEQ